MIESRWCGGFRCYEVTTHDDGSFEASKPVVLQNVLLLLDDECIELADKALQPERRPDRSQGSSLSDNDDDGEPDDVGVALSEER